MVDEGNDKTFQFMARETIPQRPPYRDDADPQCLFLCEICEILAGVFT